ncbi:hypothetical protein Agub_g9035, partial [Astrephomene gubernaculifera]
MGAGASSGTKPSASAPTANGGSAGAPSADKPTSTNGVVAPVTGVEASRDSVNPPLPKQGKHVAIHAQEKPAAPFKGQKVSIFDKLKHIATPNHVSSATSRANSVAKSTASRARRDEFDVDTDDDDLDGFIYDDDSTSEDERADYVNAFGRKKRSAAAEDYSDFEGAGVRAQAREGSRASRKSMAKYQRGERGERGDDGGNGDDELDPEERQIALLRERKRQEDAQKARALAFKQVAAEAAKREAEERKERQAAGPSNAAIEALRAGHAHVPPAAPKAAPLAGAPTKAAPPPAPPPAQRLDRAPASPPAPPPPPAPTARAAPAQGPAPGRAPAPAAATSPAPQAPPRPPALAPADEADLSLAAEIAALWGAAAGVDVPAAGGKPAAAQASPPQQAPAPPPARISPQPPPSPPGRSSSGHIRYHA